MICLSSFLRSMTRLGLVIVAVPTVLLSLTIASLLIL